MKTKVLGILLIAGLQFQAQDAKSVDPGNDTTSSNGKLDNVLEVKQVIQEKTQWCWAAVSKCVLDFYCSPISQCEVANFSRLRNSFPDVNFGTNDCCSSSSACNVPNYNWGGGGSIQDILYKNANLENDPNNAPLSTEDIYHYIANREPFVAFIQYTNNGVGHFVVGHGIEEDLFYNMNPWPGEGLKVSNISWFKKNNEFVWRQTNTMRRPAPENKNPNVYISGAKKACVATPQISYTLANNTNHEFFLWRLPNGEEVMTNTDTVSIDMSKALVKNTVTAMPMTECIQRDMLELTVSLIKKPETPKVNLIDETLVSNTFSKYNYWFTEEGGDQAIWSNDSLYKPEHSGSYYSKAVIEDCESDPSELIHFIMTESSSTIQNLLKSTKITIYPNPTTDYVNIEVDKAGNSIESFVLYDMQGKMVNKVANKQKNGNSLKVNLSNLSSGIYVLKASVEGEEYEIENRILKK